MRLCNGVTRYRRGACALACSYLRSLGAVRRAKFQEQKQKQKQEHKASAKIKGS